MLALTLILWWVRSPSRTGKSRTANSRTTFRQPHIAVSVAAITVIVLTCCNRCSTLCAQDRYSRDAGGTLLNGGDNKTRLPKSHRHLREGTRVPPTAGKIVMLGRRWAFVAANQPRESDDDLVDFQPHRIDAITVGFNSKPRPTRLGAATPNAFESQSMTMTLVRKNTQNSDDNGDDLPHVMLAENLMLQRIVEAIRADSSDDRWIVSGEVTEFFNENRLRIHTAQRANSD